MEHLESPVFFLEFLLSFMKFTVTLFFIENICVFLLQGHVIIFLILIRRIYHSNIIYFTFYILYLYFRTNLMLDLIILQIPDQVPQTLFLMFKTFVPKNYSASYVPGTKPKVQTFHYLFLFES